MQEELTRLAAKYETKEFLVGDPSWFMHQVEGDTNRELLAFIASALSYGSRKQFLPKIQLILTAAEGDIVSWLMNGDYKATFPCNRECFYRLYTNEMMLQFLCALEVMVREYGSMRGYMEHVAGANSRLSALAAVKAITQWFAEHESRGVIPKDTTSSCKRVCMFLRWMVRSESPVDLGLWADIIDRQTLIIPMDTHVLQQAQRLGLITSRTTSMAAAMKLSQRLAEFFPDDPIKADFALFGYGVDENK